MYWIRYQLRRTALHCAAMNGHIEVTSLLLDRGAYVNSKDKVSNMTRDIVMILCVTEIVIMTLGDSSVNGIVGATISVDNNVTCIAHKSL